MRKEILWAIADPEYETSVWFANSVSGLREAAGRLHLELRVSSEAQDLAGHEAVKVAILISDRLEWARYMIDELRNRKIKVVLVGAAPDDFGEDVSGVILDRQSLVAHMVQYFCEAGRRRLATVGNEENAINDMIRKRAFLQATRALGLSTSDGDVYAMTSGLEDCIERFFARVGEYDGAICVNDYVAVQLLAAARQRGIRVPEDLFIAGSGNMIMGNCTTPTLTTATLTYWEMGIQTVNIWSYLHKNPAVSALRVLIPCELVCRESTACLPPRPYVRERFCEPKPPQGQMVDAMLELQHLENCLMHCDETDFGILCGIVEGLSSERIAERLFTAPGTVQYRLKKMYQVAGVTSRRELEAHMSHRITNVDFLKRICPPPTTDGGGT